jgi:6-pyruvoyltetrahydropterin/6-carboxytetrahydropterin synthase
MQHWVLEKEFTFEASHQLMHHDGKCARLHGHSWKMTVRLHGTSLVSDGPKRGMLFDYADISKVVKPFVDSALDHYHLNDTLNTEAPTSEYVAMVIYGWLKATILSSHLHSVTVNETCTSSCTYSEEK